MEMLEKGMEVYYRDARTGYGVYGYVVEAYANTVALAHHDGSRKIPACDVVAFDLNKCPRCGKPLKFLQNERESLGWARCLSCGFKSVEVLL